MSKKISPRIKAFLLEAKRKKPHLGCREAVKLVERTFLVKISKSRVSLLWKQKGLSQPIGRPHTLANIPKTQHQNAGFIFILAADAYLQITKKLMEILKPFYPNKTASELQKTLYALIYRDLLGVNSFWTIKGYKSIYSSMLSVDNKVYEHSEDIETAIRQHILLQREIAGIKITQLDREFFLDAQMRSFYTTHSPAAFFTPLNIVKDEIESIFLRGNPLILYTIPGFSIYAPDVADFLFNPISAVSLEDIAGVEQFNLSKVNQNHCYFIFGLWPFQYKMPKGTKLIGGYKRLWFAPLRKEYLVTESEMSITQQLINKDVTLRLVHIKQTNTDNKLLTLGTNIHREQFSAKEIALLYLNRWPYIEDNATEYLYLKRQKMPLSENVVPENKDSNSVWTYISNLLSTYAKRHFFLNDKFPQFESAVLRLSGDMRYQNKAIFCKLFVPREFELIDEVKSASRRVNEIGYFLAGKVRLWVEVKVV